MTSCPGCRKVIDPLATRCPHCGGAIQLTAFQPAESSFYGAVIAPAFGAVLMSVVFGVLSPFSGYVLNVALGGTTDLGFRDYMIDADAMVTVALLAVALSALCGWLRYVRESLLLSLLSFCTPFFAPPLLVVIVQAAGIAQSA